MPHDAPKTAEDLKFQAESDVRTLSDIVEIRQDKKRLDRAMKEVRRQQDVLRKVKSNG